MKIKSHYKVDIKGLEMEKALLEEHVRYGEARFRDKELVRPFVNRIYQDIAELEEAMKPKTCEWKYENSTDIWVGACGAEMVFYNNLTPTQEKMHFCYKCGGKLIEIEPKDNA